MFKFLRKHKTVLFTALALCLIGMIFFGIGGSAILSSPQDIIIKVNGAKIRQGQFDRFYDQLTHQKKNTNSADTAQLTQEAMYELIRMEVFDQEAKKYGVEVPEQELQLILLNTPAFQKNGHFDLQTYIQTVRDGLGMTPQEFEQMRRKDLAAQKVRQLIDATVHVSDVELKEALPGRLAIETDPKKKKEIASNPEILRNEIRNKEVGLVFNDWLKQLNSGLKVDVISESFKKRLSAPQAAPQSAPPVPQPGK